MLKDDRILRIVVDCSELSAVKIKDLFEFETLDEVLCEYAPQVRKFVFTKHQRFSLLQSFMSNLLDYFMSEDTGMGKGLRELCWVDFDHVTQLKRNPF